MKIHRRFGGRSLDTQASFSLPLAAIEERSQNPRFRQDQIQSNNKIITEIFSNVLNRWQNFLQLSARFAKIQGKGAGAEAASSKAELIYILNFYILNLIEVFYSTFFAYCG